MSRKRGRKKRGKPTVLRGGYGGGRKRPPPVMHFGYRWRFELPAGKAPRALDLMVNPRCRRSLEWLASQR